MTVDNEDRTLNLSVGGQTTPSLHCSVVPALRFPILCSSEPKLCFMVDFLTMEVEVVNRVARKFKPMIFL